MYNSRSLILVDVFERLRRFWLVLFFFGANTHRRGSLGKQKNVIIYYTFHNVRPETLRLKAGLKKNKLGTWCLDQFASLRGGIILGES